MSKIEWTQINSLDELLNLNKDYVLLFKHSPRCIVSRISLLRFELGFDKKINISKFIFIDVLKKRPLSNEIAKVYSIYHESPQIILLKDNNVLFHTSHSDISFSDLENYVF
jgi:bacillithiol system protein YtxJ|tara:strand:- start:1101 stop:1433 length:333 start_codon:yes stop_codon:yes gene_type:complete